MGCFNLGCLLTQVPVLYGDPILLLYRRPTVPRSVSQYDEPGEVTTLTDCTESQLWQDWTPQVGYVPLVGTYNDYGWVSHGDTDLAPPELAGHRLQHIPSEHVITVHLGAARTAAAYYGQHEDAQGLMRASLRAAEAMGLHVGERPAPQGVDPDHAEFLQRTDAWASRVPEPGGTVARCAVSMAPLTDTAYALTFARQHEFLGTVTRRATTPHDQGTNTVDAQAVTGAPVLAQLRAHLIHPQVMHEAQQVIPEDPYALIRLWRWSCAPDVGTAPSSEAALASGLRRERSALIGALHSKFGRATQNSGPAGAAKHEPQSS